MDIEKNPLKKSSDHLLSQIVGLSKNKKVPIIFSSTKKELGIALYGKSNLRKTKVSIVSVLNTENFEKVN